MVSAANRSSDHASGDKQDDNDDGCVEKGLSNTKDSQVSVRLLLQSPEGLFIFYSDGAFRIFAYTWVD